MPAHAAKVNGAPPGASHGQANVLAPPFKEIVFQARMPGALGIFEIDPATLSPWCPEVRTCGP